ncbi:hypothetical protein ACTA71_010471 [Dictyostelium dimigraforme]
MFFFLIEWFTVLEVCVVENGFISSSKGFVISNQAINDIKDQLKYKGECIGSISLGVKIGGFLYEYCGSYGYSYFVGQHSLDKSEVNISTTQSFDDILKLLIQFVDL